MSIKLKFSTENYKKPLYKCLKPYFRTLGRTNCINHIWISKTRFVIPRFGTQPVLLYKYRKSKNLCIFNKNVVQLKYAFFSYNIQGINTHMLNDTYFWRMAMKSLMLHTCILRTNFVLPHFGLNPFNIEKIQKSI